MNRLLVFFALILMTSASGCVTSSIDSSPMPQLPPGAHSLVQGGDVLELRFLHRPASQHEPYIIQAGDELRVGVYNHEQLSQDKVLVLPDGHVSLPLVPRFKASGMSVQSLARQLAEIYLQRGIRQPDVTVSVMASGGRLRAFLQSVFQAGGEGGLRVPVELDGVIALPALGPLMANRTFGDIRRSIQGAYAAEFGPELAVIVRQAPRRAYVIGEVKDPGPVELFTDMNALMAVANAGGFLRSAALRKVRIYRFSTDTGVSQWEIDLAKSVRRGRHEEAKIQILADDVIFVPKSGVARANDAVDQYIRRMLPLSIGVGFAYDEF